MTEQTAITKQQATSEDHTGPMSRIAGACFPDFLVAVSAEMRNGTLPPFIESAVVTTVERPVAWR